MRSIMLLPLLTLATGALAAPSSAPASKASTAEGDWIFEGSLRSRSESWDFFQAKTAKVGREHDYTYLGNLLRVSAKKTGEDLDGLLEIASPSLFGLPDDAVAAPPGGQLGLGASYRAANGGRQASVFAKQANVTIHLDDDLNLKAGRFIFIDGYETFTGDPTLDWIKRERVGHRLLGDFGFSDIGRSQDGAWITYDTSDLNLTAVAAHPTVGVFDLHGNDELSDVGVRYASATLKDSAKEQDARIFVLGYSDDRALPKVDNRSPKALAADKANIDLTTFGGHYARKLDRFDVLAWGVLQRGDWASLEQRASAWDLEAGYQPDCKLKPWLRAGTCRSSGDGNPTDGVHGTFFAVLPTPRVYARFPFYNMMNLDDDFAELLLRPNKKTTLRTTYHRLRLDDAADLWYAGGGAFQETSFGFAGRKSGGSDDLGSVVDFAVDRKLSPSTQMTLYFANARGGQVQRNDFVSADASLFYAELLCKF